MQREDRSSVSAFVSLALKNITILSAAIFSLVHYANMPTAESTNAYPRGHRLMLKSPTMAVKPMTALRWHKDTPMKESLPKSTLS